MEKDEERAKLKDEERKDKKIQFLFICFFHLLYFLLLSSTLPINTRSRFFKRPLAAL